MSRPATAVMTTATQAIATVRAEIVQRKFILFRASPWVRERAISFKEALNQAVRIGLQGKKRKRAQKFVQKTFRMGEGQEFRWDKALAAADSIEDEELNRQ